MGLRSMKTLGMETLGPSSVSSALAVALKVAYVLVAVWFAVMVVSAPIGIFAAIVQQHQPAVPIRALKLPEGIVLTSWTLAVPYFLYQLVAARGAIAIVRKLKAVFESFVANQPFAGDNPEHLRRIWLTLVIIELVRISAYGAAQVLSNAYAVGAHVLPRALASPVDLSRWFLIFVVLVLAEVFRRGTLLAKDSELTV